MKEIIKENEQRANRLIININWLSAVFAYGLFYLKRFYNINDIPYYYLNSSLIIVLVSCIISEAWYRVTFKQNRYNLWLKYQIILSIVLAHFTMMAMSKEAFMLGLYFYSLIAAGLYYTNRIIIYSIVLNIISITVLTSLSLIDLNLEAKFIAFFTAVVASFISCIFILMGHLTQSTKSIKTFQSQEKELQGIHVKLQNANTSMKVKQEQLISLNQNLIFSNEKLEKAYNELQHTQQQIIRHEKMASIGQLSAGVAHEINTPVGAIKSNIELSKRLIDDLGKEINQLEDQDAKNMIAKLDNVVAVSMKSCNRIEQVVKSLRNFARQDDDRSQKIDVHILLENTLVLLNNKIKNKIEIIKEYGQILQIECFPGQLSQVFMNVIQNAIESIEQCGILIIKTELVQNGIKIKIKDNGRGIEKEKMDTLFDLSFTAKGSRMKTGLGLAAAYRIIEIHNGSIEVETKEGEGTEVISFLPLERILQQAN